MSPETVEKLQALFMQMQEYTKEVVRLWSQGILFTWQWWLLLAMTVLPWIFWIFWHKKDSTNRLLYAGFFSIIAAKLLDTIGSTFGFWQYTARLVPLMPPLFPWDATLMPVAVMTLIQLKPKIHPIIKAAALAAFAAFIMEPLAEWIGLYKSILWKHYYSFPVFIFIYLVADWLSRRERFEKVKIMKSTDR
jgi:hypothetical protein